MSVCRRAAWTGDGPGLRRGQFYHDRLDARPGTRGFDPKAVPAYAIGNRAFGRRHVGAIDPIVVLAPATPWLGLAVPVVVLSTVTVYWRRTPRGA